ncbi:MAG: VCBS repeat-containing protein [Verrucomicrobiota bacterium]
MKPCFLAALLLPLAAFAQNPPGAAAPAAPAAPILKNGNFDQFVPQDNTWDGVDNDGFLCGEVASYAAILEGGGIGQMAMPISVQVADFNQDGLLDILTLDGGGYFRIYFNSGTPTEPKFTHCETIPLFLGRFLEPHTIGYRFIRDGAKIAIGDFDKSGMQDLVLGNYYGDVMRIRNTGTPSAPEWRQPQGFDEIKIPTTRDGHLWANLLAPAVYDWNKDGKPDLLLGEGSYSANTVHLLLNTATSGFGVKSTLAFNEDAQEYLAFGDGREQLIPAVVDYNGDGNPDLLVGDRNGNINVYLSQGPWKKGAELKRQPQPISFDGVTSIGTGQEGMRCVAPAVADLNGDGKFDIIVGKPNGHIAVSYNIGTATEPKFGPLVEIKGEDLWKKGSLKVPKEWGVDFGYRQGNINSNFSVVTPEEDPEAAGGGTNVLKFFYEPNLNKIIRRQPMILPGIPLKDLTPRTGFQPDGISPGYWGESVGWAPLIRDSNVADLCQSPAPMALKPNARYMLSFKVKGRNVREGHATILFGGWLIRDLAAAKTGTPSPDNRATEALYTDVNFNVTPGWTTVSKPISFRFQKELELNQTEKWSKPGSKIEYRSLLDIRASVTPHDGVFYISDVQITPM